MNSSGLTGFELEVATTVQKIIQSEPTAIQVESILDKATPGLRSAVVERFRSNDNLRRLFPEYAAIFDKK